jgi:hypothetical protein
MTEEQREAYKQQFGQEPPSEASVRFVDESDWETEEEDDSGEEGDNGPEDKAGNGGHQDPKDR